MPIKAMTEEIEETTMSIVWKAVRYLRGVSGLMQEGKEGDTHPGHGLGDDGEHKTAEAICLQL